MSTDSTIEAWLQPISADQPCGENLEDTPILFSFDTLRLFGQARAPEAPPEAEDKEKEKEGTKPPPDWARLKASAEEALGKSKDLRVLAHVGAALLRTDGLPAYLGTLGVAAYWLDTWWAQVYPLVDEDMIVRKNALNCFADLSAVIYRVWRTPLVESRKHGRFSLRDSDLAAGTVQPAAGEKRADQGAIDAAFKEMPLEQLSSLERSVTDGLDALKRIDVKMRGEGGSEASPDFDGLTSHLARMKRLLQTLLEARGEKPAGEVEAGGGASSTERVAVGAISSREDAIRALDAVAEFFRRNEPSSPIPLFMERSKRLVSKDFLEVLADIAPEALATARTAGGLKDG